MKVKVLYAGRENDETICELVEYEGKIHINLQPPPVPYRGDPPPPKWNLFRIPELFSFDPTKLLQISSTSVELEKKVLHPPDDADVRPVETKEDLAKFKAAYA